MIRTAARLAISIFMLSFIGVTANAASPAQTHDPDAVRRLEAEGASVDLSPATGTARFVRMPRGPAAAAGAALSRASSAPMPAATAKAMKDSAAAFINRNSRAFGLNAGTADLRLRRVERDELGKTHLTYTQHYAGLPVFGAVLKAHLDADGQVAVVTGTLVPDITVSSAPGRSAAQAEKAAVKFMKPLKKGAALSARGSRLLIYREGLAKGVAGDSHLAYEVVVGNGSNVREFVYVDAHSGKVIDRITGTPDALNRRAYDGESLPDVPPSYPGLPFWVEGQAFPTGVDEADNMILASKETYDLYSNAFGRDSFDGAGATMDSIFNRGYGCPNASWNGVFISFCAGLTTDDITGHEWSHAYTEYTDGLIYAWQPGALNEASSDIFGETIDLINGRGTDSPNTARSGQSCSVYGGSPPPKLTITGGSAAGSYFAAASANEPALPFTVGPTPMALATPASACTAVTGVSGSIAIVDFTVDAAGNSECGSGARSANALAAGAMGVIFVAPPTGLLGLAGRATIATVEVSNADGATIKAGLPASATMAFDAGTEDSVRWLLGEDSAGFGGAIRDMSTPECFGNPGKVSAHEYSCDTSDSGGVHNNSGVDNHAYALMVDGGTYNGQTVTGIGLTKAAHVYFRAKTHYQGPATDFAAHADALEQSCADLVGVNLTSLTSGAPTGEVVSASDCAQIAKTLLAVEMRTPPTQCGFQPILAKNPPALCPASKRLRRIYRDNFDDDDGQESPATRWTVSREGTTPDFTRRNWRIVSQLPGNKRGRAFFGADPDIGTCGPGGDETALLHLYSPRIVLDATVTAPTLTFNHYVATEAGWDGGNLKISVNRGPWQLVKSADYAYNAYNGGLYTPDQGNSNPIAGEPAFTGTDGGTVLGSWGRSIINLAPYAKARDNIRLRFDIGNDGCGGNDGWYVDDVLLYQCR